MFHRQFDKPRVVSGYIDWPRLDLGEHAFVKVLNPKCHQRVLANTQTAQDAFSAASNA